LRNKNAVLDKHKSSNLFFSSKESPGVR